MCECANYHYFCRMEVTEELIDNLSTLARLEFVGEERTQIKADLQKMITFIEKLNELDTKGVEPLLHMSDNINVLRDDVVQGQVDKKAAFLNAPLHDEDFFLVPKVIRK